MGYGEYYDIYCDYYGCCESWSADSTYDEMFCAGWEYYIELANMYEDYMSYGSEWKATEATVRNKVVPAKNVHLKSNTMKKDANVTLIQTPAQPTAEESNWGYYAVGGAAIWGGLDFLTNRKAERRDIDEFLLQ